MAVDADVARLRRGDLNALSELIARYQNRLYRYLLRMVRQPSEAEDLFQQTWLRAIEKIRSFDGRLLMTAAAGEFDCSPCGGRGLITGILR
ncbi:MAG TPA: sigma factor [Candidatus Sulfotelmatobacter sp.]|nr:sigma factor [Candidatus Sulfotelmatobacter sp.]